MSFNLSGYVLRSARMASGNATSTGEATSGVVRDHIAPSTLTSLGYDIAPSRDVEPYADMYRAAVLQRPSGRAGTDEYLIWAATTGSLSTIESSDFAVAGDTSYVVAAEGSITVGPYSDGTDTFYVRDAGGRDLFSVESLLLYRADTQVTVTCSFESPQDPLIGKVVLDSATLSLLAGGFSAERGDRILAVTYILSGPKFWWSRNDQDTLRFGWNGAVNRWEPYKGSPPQDLGIASEDPEETYELSPPVSRFSAGDVLPGDPLTPDEFALIRAGAYPDSTGVPLNVLVVVNSLTESTYPDGPPYDSYDAVVGETNGILLLNPTWSAINAGLTLWHNPESFRPDNDGVMGNLEDLPTDSSLGHPILSPIPGPTERPFLRLGYRRHLTPLPVDTDTDLPLPTSVTAGQFYWSRSTGKTVLAEDDIKKAQPGETGYDIAYLKAVVYYDGVSMTTQPVPIQTPAPLVNEAGEELDGSTAGVPAFGKLYIQRGVCMPPPGAAGVLCVPDGTGEAPDLSASPNARPNGSGLVRQVQGVGDSFVFSASHAFADLTVHEFQEDIPVLRFRVKKTEVETSKMPANPQPSGISESSQVQLRRRGLVGEGAYFAQAQCTPAVYSEEARLYARFGEDYVLDGTEVLRFQIDSSLYEWAAVDRLGAGTFTAQEIADDLNVVITAEGTAGVTRGRVYLEADTPSTGTVEIGWNTDADDLSGHAALGFLPGWRVDASGDTFRWQPDNGATVGLYRSPENLDKSSSIADIKAVGSYANETLTNNLPPSPFVAVNNPPLEDIPGYDEGVHFVCTLGLNIIRLSNYGVRQGIGVKYDWDNGRFIWTEEGTTSSTAVLTPTDTLQMDDQLIFSETVSSDAMDPTGQNYGLYLKEAGALAYNELVLSESFLMGANGDPGQATLISVEGGLITSGGGGSFSAAGSTFSNPVLSADSSQNTTLQQALYDAVAAGYRLHVLNGDSKGLYTITSKALVSDIAEFQVTPAFPAVGNAGVTWKILEGQATTVYDPTVIADVQQVEFNHFETEPYTVRLLSAVGTVGGTLTAYVKDALDSNRPVAIRFGLTTPATQATITYLTRGTEIGTLATTGLVLPDLTDPHFTNSGATAYFQIRVGAQEFNTSSSNLSLVDTFSTTIPAGTIEVGKDGSTGSLDGEIRFADDILSDFAAETVTYDQLALSSALITTGTCQINTADGVVSLSAADTTTHSGKTAYFVEQMITERRLDVVMSPLNGAIFFNKPLREGQIVEAAYYQADTDGGVLNGTLITEYLALTVRLEEATRVDEFTYTYNPTGKTLSSQISEAVWVGVNLQNFAGVSEVTIDDGTLAFASAVDSSETVKINYGVLEAFGGEQAFNVSTIPVYRKPFFLEEDQATFTLDGDRTSEMQVGKLAFVGPAVFYVKAVSYDSEDDETSVTFFPAHQDEVGSRAPGRDNDFFLSSKAVAITVDPSDPVAGGGEAGFLLSVDTSAIPLLPADRGASEFVFQGDLTEYAQTNHLLEVGGHPYLIVDRALSDDGRFTTITVSSPLHTGYSDTDTVYISSRTIYGPSPRSFDGRSPFLDTEDFNLFLVGSTGSTGELPGKLLTEDIHYAVDPASGAVEFLPPSQAPLQPGERIIASYTALRVIAPIVDDAAILAPTFNAKYLFTSFPSLANRILGATLAAQYTYSAPDSFYFETLPLQDYLGEVAGIALSKASSSRTSGAASAFPGLPDNGEQGALGLRSEVRDLKDQDRAARTFIELYNGVVLAFEQVLEAVDGRIIGDRDGKFKFFVGRGKRYVRPGYEDQITGDISTRLIWREIIEEWAEAPLGGGYYTEDDPCFDPLTAFEKDASDRPGELDGVTPDPHTLESFTVLQRKRVKNDMDDRLLIGFGRPRGLALLFPGLRVPGLFKGMWQAHIYSRLFPERTKHFTRLLPGLQATQGATGYTDPGFYSSGRKVETPGPEPGETTTQIIRTRKTSIGKVANPALGEISNIVEVLASDRLARARIWRYYPNGDAEFDAAMTAAATAAGTTYTGTVGTATIIATPLTLGEFPVDKDTGWPDITQFLSQSGGLYDLASGDGDLSTPGFAVGDRVQFGTPDGTEYELTDSNGNGVFVGSIQLGCVITLADVALSDLGGPEVLVNESSPLEEFISDDEGRGDTLFVGVPVPDLEEVPEDGDSPTVGQMEELALALPDYRIQFDLKVRRRTGDLLDASLPTRDDAFFLPLQNMFGQKPPGPLSCIEGTVEFVNTDREPLKLPALKGEAADDSGDVQIPYMVGTNTEKLVLGEVAAQFQALLGSDTTYAMPYLDQDWKAVYPDEIVVSDGELNESYTVSPDRDPATLYTARDLTPVATAGSYTVNSAIGDVRPFDLLLVETGQPLEVSGELLTGMTGILSVAAVSSDGSLSQVEVPRFVTKTDRGDAHRYTVRRAWGHLSGGGAPSSSGMEVTSTNPANWVAILDASSVGGLTFSADTTSDTTGGIVPLLGGGNAIMVKFYSPDPATPTNSSLLGTIVTDVAGGFVYATDPAGGTTTLTLAGSGVTLDDYNKIRIETTADLLAALTLLSASTTYDFTVSLDTYIDQATRAGSGNNLSIASGAGSSSCRILDDRLTFSERVSFKLALPRGSHPANGDNIELGCSLRVWESPVGGSTGSDVNDAGEVNGGDLLTFLERQASGVPYVGTFTEAAPGSEDGRLKVMSWEGHNNTPLPFTSTPVTGVTLSALPSSNLNTDDVICEGTGTISDDDDGTLTIDGWRHWIDTLTVSAGGLANVVAGDILVIDESSTSGKGAVTTGTYLVRHAVEPNSGDVRSVELYADAGSKGGLDLRFPQVSSAASLTLVAKDVPAVPESATGCGFKTGGGATFVYIIRDKSYCSTDGASYTINANSVWRARYSSVSYDSATEKATFTLQGTFQDAEGNSVDEVAFYEAALKPGVLVSGMIYFPVTTPSSLGLPTNNCVGSDSDGATGATAGFNLAIAGNRNTALHPSGGVDTKAWDKTTATDFERLLLDGDAPSTSGSLGVRVVEPVVSTAFQTDRTTVIYGRARTGSGVEEPILGVPRHVSLEAFTSTEWELIHFDTTVLGATAQAVNCLLPRDRIMFSSNLEGGGTAGFHALGGIFLEPSFARPTTDLNLANPHVVSTSYNLIGDPDQVAHRNVSDFGVSTYSETVHFYVRRIRRFHDVQTRISDNLELLKYVYEMRKGDFDSYDTGTRVFTAGSTTYGTATNLGEFTDKKVNIHGGDVLRVLDANGEVIDTAEIQKVDGDPTLKLRRPGLTEPLTSAVSFEIYLEQAIIPHEQSNAQLLDLVTDEVVLNRTVDYSALSTDGGQASDFNLMQDTLVADWETAGVQVGDYVLVPPAGPLYVDGENGTRPIGDTSVDTRTPSPYVAGDVASLDDNRGFYKVTEIGAGDLTVDGASRFGGGTEDGADDEVFGDGSTSDYAVLPTIHASSLTAGTGGPYPFSGREGQQALRPTAEAASGGTGAFLDRTTGTPGDPGYKSIHPFPYKIIRPASIFSEDALELVFLTWERMLSWIEEMKSVYANGRGGDYYVFQRDDHIDDVGSPTDPTDGAGVISNLVIESLTGLVDTTPYANTSDCLSLLGRRFWILDSRLDEEGYTSFSDDAYSQRPVLPDLVEAVLDIDDRFRDMRFAWISYRADQVNGSIVQAKRAEEELPDELRKAQELVDQQKALKDSE